ncbi:MAG: type II secretion system protein [Candidatus Omnitrophota bacterium]
MKQAFTLLELIITIVIIGALATLGFTQYSTTIERSRLAEAKANIALMRKLAYEYYFKYGSLDGMTNASVGVGSCFPGPITCNTSNYYKYRTGTQTSTSVNMGGVRCTSGGKTPNASRPYVYYITYYPGTDRIIWHCYYDDGTSEGCFGLTPS